MFYPHVLVQNSQTVTVTDTLTLPCLTRMEEYMALDSEELSGDRC